MVDKKAYLLTTEMSAYVKQSELFLPEKVIYHIVHRDFMHFGYSKKTVPELSILTEYNSYIIGKSIKRLLDNDYLKNEVSGGNLVLTMGSKIPLAGD